jgi:cystathionine beta-synthase
VLDVLVSGKRRSSEPIDEVVAPVEGVVSPDTSLKRLREVFAQDKVAVVKEGEKVLAIVTKIDLIEHLAHRSAS